ncbi:MAG: alpha-ketoacid dehydrogenase subunit beta [Planctomycetota bacterium]|jgi:pyruvate dehydrogenase E1 component beta subunit
MAKLNMVQAINLALRQELEKDGRLIILGEDVGRDGGVFRVTDGLQEEFGKGRVVDTPLSELGIVGTSIGLAAKGMHPVAEIQFSGFLYAAYDQLTSHAARIRTRSRGRFTCPMVIRAPYGGGIRALELHCESQEAILAHTPGIKVVIPSGPYDAKGLLISAIRDPDPVVFLEPMRVYRAIKEDVPEEEYTIALGSANVLQEGTDLTVISWGAMMKYTREALAKTDYSAEVIDIRTISPLDSETVINSVKKTGRCLIVHEAPRTCGFGAEIIAQINEKAFLHMEAPVVRVTGFDVPFPMYKLENYYLPDENRILKGVEKVMKF